MPPRLGKCGKGTRNNVLEAFGILQERPVGRLFLDIKMPKRLGPNFLRSLRHPPQVIRTTAYRQPIVLRPGV